jgi:hypothetical protein
MKISVDVKFRVLYFLFIALATASFSSQAHNGPPGNDPLKYFFGGKRGQVEVGGRYVGMEFHRSRPAPSRISFYYPVANSIDLSTDYWKRDLSLPMAIGLRIAGGPVEWIHRESWSYILSPHTVTFVKDTGSLTLSVRYEFCLNQPAAVMTIVLKNRGRDTIAVQLYTHVLMSLRTCQTYARYDSSRMSFDSQTQAIVGRFNDLATDSCAVFVENVGERAAEWTTDAIEVGAKDDGESLWSSVRSSLSNRVGSSSGKIRGIAAFVFKKSVAPDDSLHIAEVVGSCRASEVQGRVAALRPNWRREVRAYDEYIHGKAESEAVFRTGDTVIDRSAVWARALIAANATTSTGGSFLCPVRQSTTSSSRTTCSSQIWVP